MQTAVKDFKDKESSMEIDAEQNFLCIITFYALLFSMIYYFFYLVKLM